MENTSIGHYRSHDPPKNFAIRITFSKLTPESAIPTVKFPSITADGNGGGEQPVELADKTKVDEEKEELIIHWQEKLFSQREFDYYSDPLNCATSVEKRYHEEIEKMRSTLGGRPNKRIFTYTDSDEYTAVEEIGSVTFSQDEQVSTLVPKMAEQKYTTMTRKPASAHRPGLRRRNLVTNEPTVVMKRNHVLTTANQRMKIMVDLSPWVKESSVLDTREETCDERVICSVKIDANGLIVTKPDIMSKKEFKIEVYHDVRAVYQYFLEDASVMITKLQKKQEASLFNELYNRHAQLMKIHVGNDLKPVPKLNEIYVHSYFEIVSAKNFEYDSLYVQYLLELPPGWKCVNGDLFGVTHSCEMNDSHVAHFCFPFDFQLEYSWPEDNPDEFLNWPVLYLQVYSLDSWQRHRIEGYGYCQFPDVAGSTLVQINMWRPKDDFYFSDMRRFFVGGTRELKDVTYVKNPVENDDSKLSKFYFRTVSTGSVVLRINTLLQTSVVEGNVSTTSKWKKVAKRIGGYAAAADSLTQVLDAFQRARKRMLTARATLPATS